MRLVRFGFQIQKGRSHADNIPEASERNEASGKGALEGRAAAAEETGRGRAGGRGASSVERPASSGRGIYRPAAVRARVNPRRLLFPKMRHYFIGEKLERTDTLFMR